MKYTENQPLVHAHISNVFDKLYDANNDIFSSFYKVIKYEANPWEVVKGVKQRKVILYIYMDSLPDQFTKYTVENDKYIKLKIKNKVLSNTGTHQKIKTKIYMVNFKPILKTIINKLQIIKIRNTTELFYISDNETQVSTKTFVNISFSNTDEIENYIVEIFDQITSNAIKVFND
jgi:hypothetical protein